jgi:capsular polysaccharide transport system permease protein
MTVQQLTDRKTKAENLTNSPVGTIGRRAVSGLLAPIQLNTLIARRLGILWYSFFVVVCFPAVICFLYLLLFASDEYESEARFAVRSSSEKPAATTDMLSALTTAVGGRSTAQDSFIVADYIRSRTIIEDLGGKNVVQAIYSRPGIDWFSRLAVNQPLEDVWEYWRHKVTAVIDTQSNVLTLRVRAFTAEDAKRLADLIVQRGENLVNEISERARRDALLRAETEVNLSLQKLAKIRAALLEFRTSANTIDPASSATSFGETLTALNREKITLESNREALRGVMDQNAPTIRFLSTQIESIEQQIKNLQEKLTSRNKDAAALSGQLAVYEDLQLQNQFAEKLFTIAQAGFEKARAEQEKQQLYVVTIVRPTLPEEASYPKPFISSAVTFAVCLMLWSMVALVIASIEDHIG